MFVSDPAGANQNCTDHGVGVLDQLVLGHLLRLARLPQQVPQEALQQSSIYLGKGIVSGKCGDHFCGSLTHWYGHILVWYEGKLIFHLGNNSLQNVFFWSFPELPTA